MEEEGWKLPRSRRRRPVSKVETSFFITRFPDKYTCAKLWEVFKEFGWVSDVFIPKKKARGGYAFAFVRFLGVSDVLAMEVKLNALVLENKRISANIALFGREEVSGDQSKRKVGIDMRFNQAQDCRLGKEVADRKTQHFEVGAVSSVLPEASFKRSYSKVQNLRSDQLKWRRLQQIVLRNEDQML